MTESSPLPRRWSRDTWIDFALSVLREDGPPGLTLDRICAAAGKTRGSFYAHFTDHDAFLRLLVGEWIARETERPLKEAMALPPGEAQRQALVDIASGMDPVLHRQVRRLAAGHADVADLLSQMDRTRLAMATGVYAATLGLSETDRLAKQIATLAYSAVVGLHMLDPIPSKETVWGDVFGDMAKAYVSARSSDPDPGSGQT